MRASGQIRRTRGGRRRRHTHEEMCWRTMDQKVSCPPLHLLALPRVCVPPVSHNAACTPAYTADRSIKLGLGDFVFYSVLVSKAALYGFATCAVCFLVIISGLGATLVLLSVFQKALPALPISIGLGVLFYFLTRVFIVPFLENLNSVPLYI